LISRSTCRPEGRRYNENKIHASASITVLRAFVRHKAEKRSVAWQVQGATVGLT
jgi:hypothetical protein